MIDDIWIGNTTPTTHSNPYKIGLDGETNDEILSLYLVWLRCNLHSNTSFPQRLYNLYGKTLICDCGEKHCHGDFLVELANKIGQYEEKHKRTKDQFANVTIFEDSYRMMYVYGIIDEIILKHGRRIRKELSDQAIAASGLELNTSLGAYSTEGGNFVEKVWKPYRKKWLDPLLKWEIPEYRKPKGVSE